MKPVFYTISILFSLLIISNHLFAETRTVDNKVNSAAQYTSVQAAIDDANPGDSILVAGSPTSYGNIIVNKELTIIGNGYRVNSTFDYRTQLSQVTFNDDSYPDDPTDSYIAGFYISSYTTFNYGLNILMERCYTTGIYIDNGNVSLTIRNVINNSFLYMYPDVDEQVTIENSILMNGVYNTNATSLLVIDHCMFLNGALQYSDLRSILIKNSIAYGIAVSGGLDVTFSNNMAYVEGSSTTFEVSGSGPNYGGSNQENVDPMFTDIQNISFDWNNDYTIQAGSPALTAADDGGEIGIYGGAYSFPVGGTGSYYMAAQPQSPLITEMNIENPSVAENGTLNVNIKATKKD
ncbi:MAG: hypothetical protein JXR07_03745 [Reichenbachiella sp.]